LVGALGRLDTTGLGALLLPQSRSRCGRIRSVDDLTEARAVLDRMLAADFEGAAEYRGQLDAAELRRHATGCSIVVDHARAAPAAFDQRSPSARLPVAAYGHGKLVIYLHGHEGYLDDLELLDASRFPDPSTVQVRAE
jgi:hypothetical protein